MKNVIIVWLNSCMHKICAHLNGKKLFKVLPALQIDVSQNGTNNERSDLGHTVQNGDLNPFNIISCYRTINRNENLFESNLFAFEDLIIEMNHFDEIVLDSK